MNDLITLVARRAAIIQIDAQTVTKHGANMLEWQSKMPSRLHGGKVDALAA